MMSIGSSGTVDQVDGKETDLSKAAQFGSSDSVSRGSLTSTNSGSGRLRAGSRSSSGFRPKAESFRARERKMTGVRVDSERLESVPQGKDQDYIEYGESKLAKLAGNLRSFDTVAIFHCLTDTILSFFSYRRRQLRRGEGVQCGRPRVGRMAGWHPAVHPPLHLLFANEKRERPAEEHQRRRQCR